MTKFQVTSRRPFTDTSHFKQLYVILFNPRIRSI